MVILERLAKNEHKINCKDLSYKVYFNEEDNFKFHEINFLEKYGMLYDLLEDLLNNKTNIINANIDKLHLIVNLMQGYDKNNLFREKVIISIKKINPGKTKLSIKQKKFTITNKRNKQRNKKFSLRIIKCFIKCNESIQ